MIKQIKWMAANSVAANLLMMIFIVGGLLMAYSIKQEVFPEIELDMISISASYPGAGPEEVEEGIILKIEEAIGGISGIDEVKATASEGKGTVTARIMEGEDIELILQDVKAEVDRITTFPEDAESPVITKLISRNEVISIAVYGNISERSIREYLEMIRDDLLAMPDITNVELSGVRPYEISIEVSEQNLRKYGLTLDSIADRVRRSSIDLPAGSVKAEGGEVLLRTKEKKYKGIEYASITILEKPDGTEVKLGDIANIRDAFSEIDEFATFDGMPAGMLKVFRVGDQRPTEISRIVQEYVKNKQLSLPESVKLATWNDTTELFKSRMNLLLKNAFLGLLLVFIILGLFLQIRLALWVMLGIPISFLGAMLLMPGIDVSINMISLFAFILALGIVVDDAIVVGENVFTHRSRGKPYLQSSIDGAIEVGTPVIFSVLTTVAAFMPLIFITGTMGKFIKVIPLVVIPILLISLVESLFILPAHLSSGKKIDKTKGIFAFIEKVRLGFGEKLKTFIEGPYKKFLSLCLKFRYITVASALALLLISAGLVMGGIVKFRFMPEVDGDTIITSLQMPLGTPVEKTNEIQAYILKKGEEVINDYDSKREDDLSVLRNTFSIVGKNLTISRGGMEEIAGSHLASAVMFLTKSEDRGIPAEEIADKWREKIGTIPGVDSLTLTSNLIHFGSPIDIRLAHESTETLKSASERLKQALRQYPGVTDIADNFKYGKSELKIRLTPEARTLGITEEELGRQIRGAFHGSEALRLQRGRNELKVMVRYPEADRKNISEVYSMRIRTKDGSEIPLTSAASIQEGRGYSSINRADKKRVINVTANAEEILYAMKETVIKDLVNTYPGLTYSMEGEEKERRDSMDSMKRGFLFALFIIYALLAIPFKSYSQPLIIMASIPFGIVGAIAGHMIMGFELSILSIFGIVALSGVVVNSAILLINYINRQRSEGAEISTAVIEAGQRRFRPILLTSLTTSLGLTPIILETSVQAQFLIPMAISLGFGVLFATGITLLLIPSLYLILEDFKKLVSSNKPVA